jgi:hypothetical protein
MTRERVLAPGRVRLTGRAWSGHAEVTRVEVSTDDGATWADAELGLGMGTHAWRAFGLDWDARPGDHVLRARATDAAGNEQPVEPVWTRGGFTNNGGDAVRVHVTDS